MTKRKKKRVGSSARKQPGLLVGVAWYTPEQWERLKQVAADAEALDDTHADWLKNASRQVQWFKQDGFQVVEVPIDVEAWVAWCHENGKALDGAARSQFTSEQVWKSIEAAPSPGPFVSRQIKPRRNPIPFLDKLETLFELERDKSKPPPYPFDRNFNTIHLPQEVEDQLRQLARSGRKIEAIKQVTQLTGAGLRLAKDYVDGLIA
jgi:hypothetical protein